ncbi:hypothetical protein [Rhodococcus chondri]|uniref:Uncharacterized protein n=1 Tax=Rhodococcus chondri TaxID=3065941 RepID=A0ABU7JRL2_9NOCA|nr:hypothetical protein [Rhodococcus sp. CC-R104]MEE2032529.1 hypothetical protein [Rhodococcus sp. CC-R104]
MILQHLSTVTDPANDLPLHPLTPRPPRSGGTVTALTTGAFRDRAQ